MNSYSLQGQVALVTGGDSGIGKGVALELAKAGAKVAINHVDAHEVAELTVDEIVAAGGEAYAIHADVSNEAEVQAMFAELYQRYGTIDILVNNAGIKEDGLMIFMKDEQWDSVLRTNLDGFFYVTRLVLHGMLLRKYGRIVNVVSLSGLKGMAGQTNYSAAKAGIIGATKALAQEVGRKGITVNAVAPGFIKTDMTEGLDEKQLQTMIPIKRFGTSEEVAHAVGFLASPEAGYITGHVLSINGGLYS